MLAEPLLIRYFDHPTGDTLDLEIAERKGLGHPDTICDSIVEQLSLGLSRLYLSECGEVLHYNVDKALLAGGASLPRFGGGRISRPMDLFLSGRASSSFQGKSLNIEDLAHQTAIEWFATHLTNIDTAKDIRVHNLIRPGSVDLADLFSRRSGQRSLANDTSCGVGYAPLSRLETLVYEIERRLAAAAQTRHPEIGRDIKVMGVREQEHFHFTIACALVDRFVGNLADYKDAKREIALIARGIAQDHGARQVSVAVNTADDLAAGRIYLTVTGTSAEAGDDGEAGRGNRINGLITPLRPMTMESAAGKNAVTHVGKLYNIAAGLIAQRLVEEVSNIDEAHCMIVSQIGSPLDRPEVVNVSLRCSRGRPVLRNEIDAIVADELAHLGSIAEELAKGTLAIGRWPLRS